MFSQRTLENSRNACNIIYLPDIHVNQWPGKKHTQHPEFRVKKNDFSGPNKSWWQLYGRTALVNFSSLVSFPHFVRSFAPLPSSSPWMLHLIVLRFFHSHISGDHVQLPSAAQAVRKKRLWLRYFAVRGRRFAIHEWSLYRNTGGNAFPALCSPQAVRELTYINEMKRFFGWWRPEFEKKYKKR